MHICWKYPKHLLSISNIESNIWAPSWAHNHTEDILMLGSEGRMHGGESRSQVVKEALTYVNEEERRETHRLEEDFCSTYNWQRLSVRIMKNIQTKQDNLCLFKAQKHVVWTIYYKKGKVTQKRSNDFKTQGMVVFEGKGSAITLLLQFGNWTPESGELTQSPCYKKAELTKRRQEDWSKHLGLKRIAGLSKWIHPKSDEIYSWLCLNLNLVGFPRYKVVTLPLLEYFWKQPKWLKHSRSSKNSHTLLLALIHIVTWGFKKNQNTRYSEKTYLLGVHHLFSFIICCEMNFCHNAIRMQAIILCFLVQKWKVN